MKTVKKSELQAAHYTRTLVCPALAAVVKIDQKSVDYDQETYSRIVDFARWLGEILSKADATISKAQAQYDNRNKELINSASLRMFSILQDINLNQKQIEHKISSHRMKVEEMRKQGFSTSEIEQIIPFPQAEIDAHTRTITDLQKEKESIEEFLSDAPAHDTDLLKGTALETFLQ